MGMIFAAFEAHCAILPQSLLPGIAISSVVFAPVFPPVGQNVGQMKISAEEIGLGTDGKIQQWQ